MSLAQPIRDVLQSVTRALCAAVLGCAALAGVLALTVSAAACRWARPFPPDAVLVPLGAVPPDACKAFYGPGPCREHGSTVVGSTDAVALWREPEENRFAAHRRAATSRWPWRTRAS